MDPHDAPTPDLPDDAFPEALQEKLRKLEQRNAELEAQVLHYERQAKAQRKAATLAGEVAVKSVAGSGLTRATERGWDAWETYLSDPLHQLPPKQETRDFAVALLARLTRVRMLYVLAAAIPSVFVLTQALLLWQQNQRIDRQNSLIAFEQTSRLRDLFLNAPLDSTYSPSPEAIVNPTESVVRQVLSFAQDEPIIVSRALRPLLLDPEPVVSIGALKVLSDKSIRELLRRHNRSGDYSPIYIGLDTLVNNIIVSTLYEYEVYKNYANYSHIYLRGSDLSFSDLSYSTFDNSIILESDMSNSNLKGSSFREAFINRVDMSFSDLSNVSFSNSHIHVVSMVGSNVFNVNVDNVFARIDVTCTEYYEVYEEYSGENFWGSRVVVRKDEYEELERFRRSALESGGVYDLSLADSLRAAGHKCPETPADTIGAASREAAPTGR
ncbi:MAG: pentapeptide repeat-containing protein [Bacteroidota bacterium]